MPLPSPGKFSAKQMQFSKKFRGQAAGEYVLLAALVLVLVGAMALGAMAEAESGIALSSARLACVQKEAANSSLQCRGFGYEHEKKLFTIRPIVSQEYSPEQKQELINLTVDKMNEAFNPARAQEAAFDPDNERDLDNCTRAAFNRYCIEIP